MEVSRSEGEKIDTRDSEFRQLYSEADDTGREHIVTILLCTVKYGDAFTDEMQQHLDRGDRKGMIATLEKWKQRLDAETAQEKGA